VTTPAERCTDCGVSPRDVDHVLLLTQSVTINRRVITWQRCARCWIKAGAIAEQEQRAAS
jgi:hypothetical protein